MPTTWRASAQRSARTPTIPAPRIAPWQYAFGVFGYVTATLATFFVGRDAENDEAELAGARQLAALREEVSALRDEIHAQSRRPE